MQLSTNSNTCNEKKQKETPSTQSLNMNNAKENSIEKFFLKENRKQGRQLKTTIKLLLRYTNGLFLFFVILTICVLNAFTDYFCLNQLYGFIEKMNLPDTRLWDELPKIYFYYMFPISLVIIRISLVAYNSIQNSRSVHHNMTFSSLYGDLLGFHDRVETARLINRFSSDIDQIDQVIIYNVNLFCFWLGQLISDAIIGILTVGFWIIPAFIVYYCLLFYYQNLYVSFRKDLYRLETVSRTPIVNLTNEILDGKIIFNTLKKESQVLEELNEHLERNTVNLTTQNALTNWFSIRVGLFNVTVVQLLCFVCIWIGLYFNVISIQRIIIFLPFCLNYILNINGCIDQMSQLETNLVALERALAFTEIPPESHYLNLKQIKKSVSLSKIAKSQIKDFIRPLEVRTLEKSYSFDSVQNNFMLTQGRKLPNDRSEL